MQLTWHSNWLSISDHSTRWIGNAAFVWEEETAFGIHHFLLAKTMHPNRLETKRSSESERVQSEFENQHVVKSRCEDTHPTPTHL